MSFMRARFIIFLKLLYNREELVNFDQVLKNTKFQGIGQIQSLKNYLFNSIILISDIYYIVLYVVL